MSGGDKRMGEQKDKDGKEPDKEGPTPPISSGGPIQEEERVGMSSPDQLPPSMQPKEERTIIIGNMTVSQGLTTGWGISVDFRSG